MHPSIKQMLNKYNCETSADTINALREILQEIALLGLWRSKFFEHGAFYGGSALRILYGLDRYSEDLDFSLLKRNDDFDFNRFLMPLQKELKAFGFDVTIEQKKKKVKTQIESAFLKTNTFTQMLLISSDKSIVKGIHPKQMLKIKLEVDTLPPPGFETEIKFLLHPVSFPVKVFTLPNLFAGKMHAILCRKWEKRIKGRDWYDLVWYIKNHPELNTHHLELRMKDSGHLPSNEKLTEEKCIQLLTEKINSLNFANAKKDVEKFVKNGDLGLWSSEFFLDIIQRIKWMD
ncbi:MAG: nucleotidyl transferase AbiEii/AbiGii toxin family protein [Candidatus Marinimicrobia bacterium]|nr:nucleotidyl transferase AbiEii/AbiGii toxin family protein [Candidatus Neomarinimicrobiota bacterium]MBL7059671.1 nucleotidyl transferase AbiEii/AbiGii toxin family protein [Candidatus Neomarinimicrobiota bacterium]